MNRVFEQQVSAEKTLSAQNFHHLRNVLRIQDGEPFQVVYQDGIFRCHFEKGEFFLDEQLKEEHESPIRLCLCFGILKGSKNEEVLQHGTEIGVSEFYPLILERCIADISKKRDQKIERWQKIVEAAAKQSKRDYIPNVHAPLTLTELLKQRDITYIVPYEDAKATTFEDVKADLSHDIGLIIGPEGGFSIQEIEMLKEQKIITLGKRILRAQTAAIVSSFYIIHSLERSELCKKHSPS